MERVVVILSLVGTVFAGISIYFTLSSPVRPVREAFVFTVPDGYIPPKPSPRDSVLIAGEELFKARCSACHHRDRKLIGPRLKDVRKKYANDMEWLYEWVRNSPGLIQKGDPKAIALFEQYNKQMMIPFPDLTNNDIDAILKYADAAASEPPVAIP